MLILNLNRLYFDTVRLKDLEQIFQTHVATEVIQIYAGRH